VNDVDVSVPEIDGDFNPRHTLIRVRGRRPCRLFADG
jgi:hypothetical protein